VKKPLKKYSKADVDYSEGTPSEHCAICVHFQVYHKHACEVVKGVILPQMWCTRFSRQQDKNGKTTQKSSFNMGKVR